MRLLVTRHDAHDVKDLKMAICLTCSQITRDKVAKAISEFPLRLEALLECERAHSERTFKAFKISSRGRTKCNVMAYTSGIAPPVMKIVMPMFW